MPAGVAELEILLKARDEASKVLKSAGTAGQKAGEAIQKHWKEASLVLGGAGLALEGLARSQAESNKAVERLGAQLGITNEEVRNMATDLSNVTFPLEDVLALMEAGTRAGLESEEALKQYATNWDLIGDATGLAGPVLADAGVALAALGIAAGEEEKAMAAFGFITDSTKSDVAEFLKFIEKTSPELKTLGLTIDETAALLGVMEGELGLSAKTAQAEFIAAMSASDGSLEDVLATLGLTTEEFELYTAKVAESSGVIKRNADIHAASFTPIQKLQSAIADLAFEHAGAIKAAAEFAPLLIAAGPAAGIAMGAFNALKASSALLKSSFLLTAGAAKIAWAAMTGPVGLAIIAITAIIAIGVLLFKNWDTIKEKALVVFGAVLDGLLFLKDTWESIWTGMKDFVVDIWDGIVDVGKGAVNQYIGILNTLIRALNTIQVTIPRFVPLVGGKSFGINISEIPTLAHGGIVTRPTIALIGENGPEAVIPLTGAGRGGFVTEIKVSIVNNGTITSGDFEEEVSRAVRDGINRGRFDGILAPA